MLWPSFEHKQRIEQPVDLLMGDAQSTTCVDCLQNFWLLGNLALFTPLTAFVSIKNTLDLCYLAGGAV